MQHRTYGAIFFLLLVAFGIPQRCLSILAIDVDEFSFPSTAKRGIRVIQFDTDTQKFKQIDYLTVLATDRASNSPLSYEDIPGLTLYTSGNVEVKSTFDLTKFMLRTKGEITLSGNLTKPFQWKAIDSHSVLQSASPALSGEAILKKLKTFAKQAAAGGDFTVSLSSINPKGDLSEPVAQTFKSISPQQKENSDERGRIGEVSTILTMFDFGYLALASKYEANHGNDGLFKTRDNGVLFLTESKCRTEKKSASKYLEEDLSEKEIYRKLQKMHEKGGIIAESAEDVELFIQDSPEAIFKFAHRVKDDGKCQCEIQEFSLEEYNKCLPPVDLTYESGKVELMQETCEKLEVSSPEKLRIFMKANNLTVDDIQILLKEIR